MISFAVTYYIYVNNNEINLYVSKHYLMRLYLKHKAVCVPKFTVKVLFLIL